MQVVLPISIGIWWIYRGYIETLVVNLDFLSIGILLKLEFDNKKYRSVHFRKIYKKHM